MTSAKFIELYPCPKDIAAFEKTYQEEHVPMVIEKLVGKNQNCYDQGVRFPEGHTKILSSCRNYLPVDGGFVEVHDVRRREGNNGARDFDLERRRTDFLDSTGGRDAHIRQGWPRGGIALSW